MIQKDSRLEIELTGDLRGIFVMILEKMDCVVTLITPENSWQVSSTINAILPLTTFTNMVLL